ncbi:jg22011, partial [Pararge aegeria aegeria]
SDKCIASPAPLPYGPRPPPRTPRGQSPGAEAYLRERRSTMQPQKTATKLSRIK